MVSSQSRWVSLTSPSSTLGTEPSGKLWLGLMPRRGFSNPTGMDSGGVSQKVNPCKKGNKERESGFIYSVYTCYKNRDDDSSQNE